MSNWMLQEREKLDVSRLLFYRGCNVIVPTESSQGSLLLLTGYVLNQLVCSEIQREPTTDIFSVHLVCLFHLREDLGDQGRVVKGQSRFAEAHAVA
jgi:hypothetical protein